MRRCILVEGGLAVCTERPQEKRPGKKVYSISPKGRETLTAALMIRENLRS